MIHTTSRARVRFHPAALALLAVAACDAPPPQGAADVARDTSFAPIEADSAVVADSLAALDSLAAAAADSVARAAFDGAPVTPGPEVGPEDFRVGVEPVDPALRVPEPEHVRALYINAYTAGSNARMNTLIGIADRTEINAFVIDIKEADGQVTYRSTIPIVRRVGANQVTPIGNVRALLTRLREHGIYPIARIVVFKDPTLAQARPDWAIQTADQRLWRDQNGVAWVDSYNRNVWEYNLALAREAIALGFAEVQWDYVRFPDVPASYMRSAVYPARAGRTRPQAIREFMAWSHQRLDEEFGVPVTADVFGVTTSSSGDVGIGQHWESMSPVIDVLLPMVYPSHYPRGSFGLAHPNAEPYHTVLIAMRHGVRRSRALEDAADIRPWLQDFTLGRPPYGAAHVRAQIQAVYDAGLTEWVLWNASSRYTAAALADASGNVPEIAGLAELLDAPAAGVRVPEAFDSIVPADVDTAAGDTAVDEPKLLGEPKDTAGE
ncbi:MAG TPA: putative glycoside hydrolase [Longimicrobiales bacterium]